MCFLNIEQMACSKSFGRFILVRFEQQFSFRCDIKRNEDQKFVRFREVCVVYLRLCLRQQTRHDVASFIREWECQVELLCQAQQPRVQFSGIVFPNQGNVGMQ